MSKKRSIFEEVDAPSGQAAPSVAGMIDRASTQARGWVAAWLGLVFFAIAANVLLGVLNRKAAMGPDQIFWLPVAIWAGGFVLFAVTKRLPTGWMGRLLGTGILTGALALSGEWSRFFAEGSHFVEIESYHVLLQRALAYGAMGVLLWQIMQLRRSEVDLMTARRGRHRRLWILSLILLIVAFLHVLRSAVLGGLYEADLYTNWPLIEGQILPTGLFAQDPFWRNSFENPLLAQFSFRVSGLILLLLALYIWVRSRKNASPSTRMACSVMALMALVQFGLGAAMVMTSAWWHGALSYQVGTILLWVLILRARFLTGYPMAQSVRD